ncbi:TolC family outer membrane protein [Rhodoblastus acidophilus]|uniref:TolC family outer membrane protein n=1 Tax=Candidatus Rhodoblastus alkanivorans TaxID=2954117 RepID=A0ABS9Z526_9HYPH|nr:TolC family outer membrane protein [Candidatus Rhodoblastus alkanivorans]MCI4680313.1 TolC family outer membrane protein [Candidatus Rhodoblastus alkanivorans]MCI4682780.1 TolC family outer membrane protein [Candidatus Rhodoblastus alkanivorans]MDI4640087.1 TolC family outer membrane protein [Rhodoblastus acidophilus]
MTPRARFCLVALLAAAISSSALEVAAETISGALGRAYRNNPELNEQRAAVRASDESVPQAKSGWRPKINGSVGDGPQYSVTIGDPTSPAKDVSKAPAATYEVGLTQNLFDGGRTANSVSEAESSVLAARALLRQTESNTLQTAATAYMNVMRDTAILNLRQGYVEALKVELVDARARFDANEVMWTDVAQAQTFLAVARADLAMARSNLEANIANYRRVVGVAPEQLQPARPIEKLLPGSLRLAIAAAMAQHPAIIGALHQAAVAEAAVKVAESALLPTVVAQGAAQQPTDFTGPPDNVVSFASVGGQINIPIYQGGAEYAAIRQARQHLAEARLAVESQRAAVRARLSTAWGRLVAARATIPADEATVRADEFSLMGLREEAKDGLRTTLDILNAHQALLNSRIRLLTAQYDRVVASYAVMTASGLLSAQRLGLAVTTYDPRTHYDQTRDRFIGVDTPDGR